MKRLYLFIGIATAFVIIAGLFHSGIVSAQDPLKMGTILQRTELVLAPGTEAILVLREVPPGGASGWHTQSGNEIVYIEKGSVILEIKGKDPVTVKAGEAFTTAKGDVHNVKNASATEPARAMAFYVAKKGAKLEDLSLPAE